MTSRYKLLDRILHRLALGSATVAEISFDLDQSISRPSAAAAGEGRHVFITGLARAGTTILMRRFHETGMFRSLTYRDMPFVLAPNLWRRISIDSRNIEAAERAHGDGIRVDADSPESFDEAFWRVFDGESYIRDDMLIAHEPTDDHIESFRRYVGAVLSSTGATRYLSKNNNNLLRLPAIRRAFPNALVLAPFREPRAHAASLLRQHRKFVQAQQEDPFILKYMNWLGHHEFGLGRRPFMANRVRAAPNADPESMDYWLGLWIDVYSWMLETVCADVVFVCYEDLCSDPAIWRSLAERAGLPADPDLGDFFTASRRMPTPAVSALSDMSVSLYERLRSRAVQTVPTRARASNVNSVI